MAEDLKNPPADAGQGQGIQEQAVKTFTQEELERILAERLERERRKYADYEELKKAKEELEKIKEAQLSEQERLQKRLADMEAKVKEATAKANERLIRAEVMLYAAEMGLVDADAALALMDRSKVTVKDDGTVEGVKEALEALVKAKPWLKKQAQNAVGGGTNPPNSGATINPWKRETFNLTMQAKILRENPALAERLKAEAGMK